MITPSRPSARMLRAVCETRVPSSTGNVSRIRPTRRESTMARAGSPRRAGSVADISTPIIVAEVTSRRRSGLRGSAARAIANQETARKNMEAIIKAVAISTQPASERTTLATTFWRPIRCAAIAVRTRPRRPATPSAMRLATRCLATAWAGGRIERRKPPGRPPGAPIDRRHTSLPGQTRGGRGGLGRVLDLLVHLLDLRGDARPGVASGRFACRATHRLAPGRLEIDPLELLRQPLRVGRWHQHAVGAVGDHVGVPRDRGGDHRRAGRERLRQHHPEALSGERGRAEHVGLVQVAPELLAIDPAERLDPRAHGRIGHVALYVLGVGADHGQSGGHVLGQPLERLDEDGQALSLLRPAHEQQPELVGPRLGAQRWGVDVDAVRDHAILAPEPALPRPGGGLRDRDPRLELVELAACSEQVGGPVGRPLGGVGVEGPHHRGIAERARVPAQQRRRRLVHVDHVEAAGAQLAPHLGHRVGKGRQVGDGAVGADPHAAPQRDQVLGAASHLGRGAVERLAEAVGRIPGSQRAQLRGHGRSAPRRAPRHGGSPHRGTSTSRA